MNLNHIYGISDITQFKTLGEKAAESEAVHRVVLMLAMKNCEQSHDAHCIVPRESLRCILECIDPQKTGERESLFINFLHRDVYEMEHLDIITKEGWFHRTYRERVGLLTFFLAKYERAQELSLEFQSRQLQP